MKIKPFKLECNFAKYEFTAQHLLSCSDCEPFFLHEVLEMADNESLKLWQNLKLSYTESSGHPILKEEIAKLYSTIQPNEMNVMIPEEAIFVAMNCLLEKDDHVITTFPGYQSLYEIANSLNCKVSKWTPDFDQGWNFDIDKLKSLFHEKTKLLVINFPHNPTGASISNKQLNEIIELCRQNNTLLFSDEMYRFLEYETQNRLASACDLYENAISLFGLSKSFALPGLRIGWLASKNKKLMQNIAEFKDYTSICNNAPGEILSIIALRNKELIFDRNLSIISKNLKVLDSFFNNYSPFFNWKKPLAGPICFPELKANIHIAEFCLQLIEQENTMLLPSSVYDFEGNFFRIGFARKNLAAGIDRLEHFIQNNKSLFDKK